jgi:hypothetical protein
MHVQMSVEHRDFKAGRREIMKKCLLLLLAAALAFVFGGTALAQEPQDSGADRPAVQSDAKTKKPDRKSRPKRTPRNRRAPDCRKEESRGEAANVPITPPWGEKDSTP